MRILLLLLLTLAPAWADEAPPAPAPEVADGGIRLRLEGPVVLAQMSEVPYGFQEKHLGPTFRLAIDNWETLEAGKGAKGYFDIDLRFLTYSSTPIIGLGGGVRGRFSQVEWELGLQFVAQNVVSKAPFQSSQYDVFMAEPHLRLDYLFGLGRVGAKLKMIGALRSTLSDFEGLDTRIAHDPTWVFSPEARIDGPFGLHGLAGIDIYSLGATGIASPEFAFAVTRGQPVYRFRVGASFDLDPRFTVSAELRRVTAAEDPTAFFYRAPFFGDDYLLSPTVLIGGITCKF